VIALLLLIVGEEEIDNVPLFKLTPALEAPKFPSEEICITAPPEAEVVPVYVLLPPKVKVPALVIAIPPVVVLPPPAPLSLVMEEFMVKELVRLI
jgi:hypothetical protein